MYPGPRRQKGGYPHSHYRALATHASGDVPHSKTDLNVLSAQRNKHFCGGAYSWRLPHPARLHHAWVTPPYFPVQTSLSHHKPTHHPRLPPSECWMNQNFSHNRRSSGNNHRHRSSISSSSKPPGRCKTLLHTSRAGNSIGNHRRVGHRFTCLQFPREIRAPKVYSRAFYQRRRL